MNDLSKKAWKTLSQWAADGYYVYIRPTTTKWYVPDEDHRLFWSVAVEFRHSEWIIWNGKCDNLDLLIREMGEQIPRRVKLHKGFVPATDEDTIITAPKGTAAPKIKKNKVYLEIRKSSDKRQPETKKKKGKKK